MVDHMYCISGGQTRCAVEYCMIVDLPLSLEYQPYDDQQTN
jgi:hypothetical protein